MLNAVWMQKRKVNRQMDMFFLIMAVGLILLGIWLFFEKMNCTKVVEGIFVGNQTVNSGRTKVYTPIFRYEIGSVLYEGQTMEAYVDGGTPTMYVEGETYPIHVNGKRPTHFVLNHKVRIDDVSLILAGVMFGIFLFL